MPYVENRTIHDADSHVMELPDTILQYFGNKDRQAFEPFARQRDDAFAAQVRALHDDPAFRAGAEEEILLRRNHQALGSFRKEDRPATLDYLGFTSQLVFTTEALDNYGLEDGQHNTLACAAARAHNRMMVDFCGVDRRLLATGYVPLVDFTEAHNIAAEALQMGCKALVIPSRCPPGHSPSHLGFEPTLVARQKKLAYPFYFMWVVSIKCTRTTTSPVGHKCWIFMAVQKISPPPAI
jgi:hypothetical protein